MQVLHTPRQMFFARQPPARPHASHALLCLLLLGLLLQGPAHVLRQLLGAAHWHAAPPAHHAAAGAPAQPAAWRQWLAEVRSLRQQMQARSPLVGSHAVHGHHHGSAQRHHHDPADATVVTLEPLQDRDAVQADAASASLLQPLGLTATPAWRLPPAAAPAWPAAAEPHWRSAQPRLPERPPRA